MPYYERTGMISHRHPFYGFGYTNPFQTPGPWAPEEGEAQVTVDSQSATDELTLEEISADRAAEQSRGIVKPSSLAVPLLILGGVVGIFWLTLRK